LAAVLNLILKLDPIVKAVSECTVQSDLNNFQHLLVRVEMSDLKYDISTL